MSNPREFKVGQELYMVSNDPRSVKYRVMDAGEPGRVVTITAIGRRWATLDSNNGRVDMETLELDGGGYTSHARCWLSMADHINHEKMCFLLHRIRTMTPSGPTLGMTVARLEAVAVTLGLLSKEDV